MTSVVDIAYHCVVQAETSIEDSERLSLEQCLSRQDVLDVPMESTGVHGLLIHLCCDLLCTCIM